MKVSKFIEIDYGHTLSQHYSFCNQIHGHRGRIVAIVDGEIQKEKGSSQGMVYDFKILKELLMEKIHDVLDHGFAVCEHDKNDLDYIQSRNDKVLVTPEPPTAEYLAKWAFNQIAPHLPDGITLVEIQWYETPTSIAYYTLEEYNNERK